MNEVKQPGYHSFDPGNIEHLREAQFLIQNDHWRDGNIFSATGNQGLIYVITVIAKYFLKYSVRPDPAPSGIQEGDNPAPSSPVQANTETFFDDSIKELNDSRGIKTPDTDAIRRKRSDRYLGF